MVQLANNLDNTADIMYELGKNPSKAIILKQLAQLNPRMAALEIQLCRIPSQQNQAAQQVPSAQTIRRFLSIVEFSNCFFITKISKALLNHL